MEEVIRSRFDGGLLGTNNTAYKRLLKRFSSANQHQHQLDCTTLLKELSAFETTLSLSDLARQRFSHHSSSPSPPPAASAEPEEVEKDLQLREEELAVRSAKRRKVEKVNVLRRKLNKLPSRLQLEEDALRLENETKGLEEEIQRLQVEVGARRRRYRVLVECVDRLLDHTRAAAKPGQKKDPASAAAALDGCG